MTTIACALTGHLLPSPTFPTDTCARCEGPSLAHRILAWVVFVSAPTAVATYLAAFMVARGLS